MSEIEEKLLARAAAFLAAKDDFERTLIEVAKNGLRSKISGLSIWSGVVASLQFSVKRYEAALHREPVAMQAELDSALCAAAREIRDHQQEG